MSLTANEVLRTFVFVDQNHSWFGGRRDQAIDRGNINSAVRYAQENPGIALDTFVTGEEGDFVASLTKLSDAHGDTGINVRNGDFRSSTSNPDIEDDEGSLLSLEEVYYAIENGKISGIDTSEMENLEFYRNLYEGS